MWIWGRREEEEEDRRRETGLLFPAACVVYTPAELTEQLGQGDIAYDCRWQVRDIPESMGVALGTLSFCCMFAHLT